MRARTLVIFAALAAAAPASADIIKLKNGHQLEGDVVQDDGAMLKIKMKHGFVKVEKTEVLSVEEKPTPEQEYAERLGKIDAAKANDHLELALWAQGRDLDDEALAQFLETVKIDPDNEEAAKALKALDWHRMDGKWVNADTWYPAQGWVKYEGSWTHPLQYRLYLSEAILKKLKENASEDKRDLSKARSDAKEIAAQIARDERATQEIPAHEERLQGERADDVADQAASARRRDDARGDVKEYQYIYDQERLKESRGEPNSVALASADLSRARRELGTAEAELVDLERRIAAIDRAIAADETALAAAEKRLEKSEAAAKDAQDRVDAAQRAYDESSGKVDAAETEVEKARKDWAAAKK